MYSRNANQQLSIYSEHKQLLQLNYFIDIFHPVINNETEVRFTS